MAGIIVNPTNISNPDGSVLVNDLFGKAGDQLVTELHGKYYNQAYRGEMFYASQIAPVVATIYSATTITGFQIWNTSTNKLVVPARMIVHAGVVPSAPGTLGFAITKNAGFNTATAAPILTQTTVAGLAPQNCNTASSVSSNVTIGTGGTITTAPTLSQYVGLFSLEASTSLAANSPPVTAAAVYDFDGQFCWGPGTFVSLATAIANTGSYQVTLFWYEVPL
jgi:hypothetical protein